MTMEVFNEFDNNDVMWTVIRNKIKSVEEPKKK